MRRNPDLDIFQEILRVEALNLSAKLPLLSMEEQRNLTRAFHINTILGRLLAPWIYSLRPHKGKTFGPVRWHLAKYDDEGNFLNSDEVYKYRDNPSALAAAYSFFRDELLKAIKCLPSKVGLDYLTHQQVDVLKPIFDEFPEIVDLEEEDLLQHITGAWNIFEVVFDPPSHQTEARNFANFIEVIIDEFLTIGEIAPAFNEELPERFETPLVEELRRKKSQFLQIVYREKTTMKHYRRNPNIKWGLYLDINLTKPLTSSKGEPALYLTEEKAQEIQNKVLSQAKLRTYLSPVTIINKWALFSDENLTKPITSSKGESAQYSTSEKAIEIATRLQAVNRPAYIKIIEVAEILDIEPPVVEESEIQAKLAALDVEYQAEYDKLLEGSYDSKTWKQKQTAIEKLNTKYLEKRDAILAVRQKRKRWEAKQKLSGSEIPKILPSPISWRKRWRGR